MTPKMAHLLLKNGLFGEKGISCGSILNWYQNILKSATLVLGFVDSQKHSSANQIFRFSTNFRKLTVTTVLVQESDFFGYHSFFNDQTKFLAS